MDAYIEQVEVEISILIKEAVKYELDRGMGGHWYTTDDVRRNKIKGLQIALSIYKNLKEN